MTPASDRVVIEIGPGKGVLTQFLLNEDLQRFIPIEIDGESYDYLLREWPQLKEELLLHDFLKIDVASLGEEQLQIIGNFPYNISSQIFFKILESKGQIKEVVCMVQKEVAERIRSGPGTKKYGILSVLLQAYYHIEILFFVNENVFSPPPKVKSSVMRLTRNERDYLACDEHLFLRVVKTGFNQRRKTLRNSLKNGLFNQKTDEALMSKRPEELGVEEFITLTNFISNNL